MAYSPCSLHSMQTARPFPIRVVSEGVLVKSFGVFVVRVGFGLVRVSEGRPPMDPRRRQLPPDAGDTVAHYPLPEGSLSAPKHRVSPLAIASKRGPRIRGQTSRLLSNFRLLVLWFRVFKTKAGRDLGFDAPGGMEANAASISALSVSFSDWPPSRKKVRLLGIIFRVLEDTAGLGIRTSRS